MLPAAVITSESSRVKGLLCMVASCALFSLMGTIVWRVQVAEPASSALVASFIRIVVNLLVLLIWGFLRGDWQDLVGDRRASLWWRGVFGSLALITSFMSIKAIGIGEASFLLAGNGVFVAVFAPFFLRQPNSAKVWIAIFGAMCGLFLLMEPRLDDLHPYGRGVAVLSGMLSALAYMMIARAGRSNSPNSVIFYFCIVACGLHLVLFAVRGVVWPVAAASYLLLVVAGLLGSFAQVFLTMAYQGAPAAQVSAVSYLQPVLSLTTAVLIFDRQPDAKAFLGAAIVLAFGVALPFTRVRRRSSH